MDMVKIPMAAEGAQPHDRPSSCTMTQPWTLSATQSWLLEALTRELRMV